MRTGEAVPLTTFENATVSRNIRSGAPLSLNEYAWTTLRSTAIGCTIRSWRNWLMKEQLG